TSPTTSPCTCRRRGCGERWPTRRFQWAWKLTRHCAPQWRSWRSSSRRDLVSLKSSQKSSKRTCYVEMPQMAKSRNHEIGIVHSHSIVPGGFDVMSYTTRLIPRTSFTMRLEMVLNTSYGTGTQSAVMPSSEWTARIAQVYA